MSGKVTLELQNLNMLFFKSSTSQSADVIHLHRGLVSLFKRPGSNQWQCRFKLPNGEWHSISTGRADLEEAKQSAVAIYERTMAKISQELSLKSKSFKQLAAEDLLAMDISLKEGSGKAIFKDYKFVLNKYLIPFFGSYKLNQITPELVKEFESWRLSQMGRDPQASTKRTNAAKTAANYALAPVQSPALPPRKRGTNSRCSCAARSTPG